MSENIQNTENNKPEKSSEIDLGELFRMIGRGFNRFFRFVSNMFLLLVDLIIRTLIVFREHVLKFIIVGVLSIILGFFIDSRMPTVYASNMVVQLNYESELQLYNNVKYYNSLIMEGDTTQLIDVFDIEKEQAGSLRGVYIEPVVTELDLLKQYDKFMKETDSINVVGKMDFTKFKRNINPLQAATHRIGAASLQKDIFKKIQDKIVSLDVENEYVKRRKDVSYKNLVQEEEELKKRLSKIDTLRNVYNEAIRSEAKKTSQAQTQIQMSSSKIQTKELELFTLDQTILARLSKIKELKELNQDVVNVLSNFSDGIESVDFYDKYLYRIPIVTISLLLIFILLRELNKYLNTYAEKKRLNNA
ncbi:MAG: hypothetical protein AAF617_06675 [Bacteroidota bacterium]